MRTVAAVVLVCGCGRIGFDPQLPEPPADSANGDADTACVLGPWSSPSHLKDSSSTQNELSPALAPDGLTLYFVSDRVTMGDYRLYQATRPSHADPFTSAVLMPMSIPGRNEYVPSLTNAGLILYFSTTIGGARKSVRASTSDPFTVDLPAPELNGVFAGGFSQDGSEAFFGYPTISRAHYDAPSTSYIVDGPVPELNIGMVGYPTLSGDGLTLYFDSDQGGPSSEIFQATRPTLTTAFGASTAVAELAGYGDDPEISADGRTFVFVSTRPPAIGADDLFMSTRDCL